MLEAIEQFIVGSLQGIFDQFGWLGVSGMMVFENATGITPSEIILGLAGWMLISNHQLPITYSFLGGLFAALGSVAGASIAYWVARLGGRPLIDRIARSLRIDPAEIDRTEKIFQRWGPGLVLFGRVIPGVRTLVSIPAGLARMSYPVFVGATFIGAYVWCTFLLGLGFVFGQEYALISLFLREYAVWLFAVLGVIGIGFLAYRWRLWRRQKTKPFTGLVSPVETIEN